MLTKQHRFIGNKEIPQVLRKGRQVSGDGFSFKFVSSSRPQSRVAIVISKKTAKRAIIRNRIRRRVYSFFRQHLPDLVSCYDIVVLVRDEKLADIGWESLHSRLLAACRQAGILN